MKIKRILSSLLAGAVTASAVMVTGLLSIAVNAAASTIDNPYTKEIFNGGMPRVTSEYAIDGRDVFSILSTGKNADVYGFEIKFSNITKSTYNAIDVLIQTENISDALKLKAGNYRPYLTVFEWGTQTRIGEGANKLETDDKGVASVLCDEKIFNTEYWACTIKIIPQNSCSFDIDFFNLLDKDGNVISTYINDDDLNFNSYEIPIKVANAGTNDIQFDSFDWALLKKAEGSLLKIGYQYTSGQGDYPQTAVKNQSWSEVYRLNAVKTTGSTLYSYVPVDYLLSKDLSQVAQLFSQDGMKVSSVHLLIPDYPIEAKPAAEIDFKNEVLYNLISDGTYKIDSTDYVADNNGKIAIVSNWFGKSISIIKTSLTDSKFNSDPQSLTIPARPATPTGLTATQVTTDSDGTPNNDGTISGVTTAMEYKRSTDSSWTAVTSDGMLTDLNNGTYNIRVKATSSAFASEAFNVPVSLQGAAEITINTQPTDITATATEIDAKLNVGASVTEDAELSYQWYKNATNSLIGGTKIEGAASSEYALPTDLSTGTYYYYCEVSATKNAESVTTRVVTVTINAKVYSVTGVSLNKTTLSLNKGKSETLNATIAPENATNKKLIWSSGDSKTATVDANGKVTAVAAGTTTITVTTEDGNKTAACEVTVTVPSVIRPTVGDRIITNSEAINDGDYSQLGIKGVNELAYYSDIYGFEVKVAFTSGKASVEFCANSANGWKTIKNAELGSADDKVIKFVKDDGSNIYGTSSWAQFFIQNLGKEANGNTDYEIVYIYALDKDGKRLTDKPLFGSESSGSEEPGKKTESVNEQKFNEALTTGKLELKDEDKDNLGLNKNMLEEIKSSGKDIEVTLPGLPSGVKLTILSDSIDLTKISDSKIFNLEIAVEKTLNVDFKPYDGKTALIIPSESGEFGFAIVIVLDEAFLKAAGFITDSVSELVGKELWIWHVKDGVVTPFEKEAITINENSVSIKISHASSYVITDKNTAPIVKDATPPEPDTTPASDSSGGSNYIIPTSSNKPAEVSGKEDNDILSDSDDEFDNETDDGLDNDSDESGADGNNGLNDTSDDKSSSTSGTADSDLPADKDNAAGSGNPKTGTGVTAVATGLAASVATMFITGKKKKANKNK